MSINKSINKQTASAKKYPSLDESFYELELYISPYGDSDSKVYGRQTGSMNGYKPVNEQAYLCCNRPIHGWVFPMDRQILSMNTIIYQLVIQSINWNYLVPVHVL